MRVNTPASNSVPADMSTSTRVYFASHSGCERDRCVDPRVGVNQRVGEFVDQKRGVPNETPGVPLGTPRVSSKSESFAGRVVVRKSRGKPAEKDQRREDYLPALSVNPRVRCFRTRIESLRG